MNQALIECVPNISEGRNTAKIQEISNVVTQIEGVKLLDVDSGKATNRTVITFVGNPEAVVEAAFLLIKKAAELIDMREHKGEHPRFGATDVCPLIPISGISMEETAQYAHRLGERVGKELDIPVYYYENAATEEKRRNLAHCRAGEYEGLPKKIIDPQWKPDAGPALFNEKVAQSGAIAISARDFLVALNVNLNSTSERRANAIAFDIREAGRIKKEGNSITGKNVLDKNGEPLRIPGKLKAVKGIGWYIAEYGIAQVSYNLTNINITPMHLAFDETVKAADARGIRVTGSELVGLVPLQSMLDAADFYLSKQQRSLGISETEKIKIAAKSLGLDDLKPFDPQKSIIEYQINSIQNKLIDKTISAFTDETASESMAPGGGSIAALVGALGVSLGTMVANLSANKPGWDENWKFYSEWAVKGQKLKKNLLFLVDEDTLAFNQIIEALRLPKSNEIEKKSRTEALEKATQYATSIPLQVMENAFQSMEILEEMSVKGLQNSLSDAGVGMLCAKTAVMGAYFNVKINAKDLKDHDFAIEIIKKADIIYQQSLKKEAEVTAMILEKLG